MRGRWRGPLYVLTNGSTYSAAEMFAATLQNNGAARVVGTRSGGDGCGFMIEGTAVTLPGSRLRVRMPNCVRLRSDGSNEVAGIAPDLPVQAREGESARARTERLIAEIATDLERKSPLEAALNP
jgi:C-terminal processing protease CtpA/Prc